jgi:VIT1/CCC1 family predicted Fe2+/Mn2+ transporter
MGFANLIADGISMGFGDYLSSRAEIDYALNEKKRETWELQNYPEGEKKEMVEIYMNKGMTEEEATTIIDVFARHEELFVDLMMVEELGLEVPDEDATPWKEGVVTFLSFLCFGSVPLWMYVIFKLADPSGSLSGNMMFGLTCLVTALTMFLLGVFKAKVTKQQWWKSGLFMLVNGSIAAAAAYLVGYLFEEVFQIEMS